MTRRYEVLDALRGVGALAVVWLHIGGATRLTPRPPNAHLAVDFFFCLSGFVIAHAYEGRLRLGLSVMAFTRERLIRLMPLAAAGALLGGAVLMVRTGLSHDTPVGHVLAATALNALLLPSGDLIATHRAAYGVDMPLWSLFWELAINVVFAVAALRLTTRRLVVAVVIGALAMAWLGLAEQGVDAGSLRGNFWLGSARVLFPFACGVLLNRLPPRSNRLGPLVFIGLAALLFGPAVGPIGEISVVLVAFPAMVWIGAGAKVGPRLGRVCLWLGAASYPIYVLHEPLVRLASNLTRKLGVSDPVLVSGLCFGLAIAAAWAAMALYDEPLRARLRRAKAAPARTRTPEPEPEPDAEPARQRAA
jgi:peptidoglycan/LPS O-acetylase OafA/YrhL